MPKRVVRQTGFMPRLPSTLNDKQVEILRWVQEGCPGSRYLDGFAHRITARALEARGYVTIHGHGASWSCLPTTSGIAWLEVHPVATPEPVSSAADELIDRVLAADGSLRVSRREVAELGSLVGDSLRSRRRPVGQRLVTRQEGLLADRFRVELAPHYEEVVPPAVVEISDTAGILRPLAKALLKNREWSFVSPDHLQRAARALQALEIEFERRGWAASEPPADLGDRRVHWRARHAHMHVDTEHTAFLVQVAEVSRSGGAPIPFAERGSPEHRRLPQGRPPWIGSRSTEFVPSGRLMVRLWGFMQDYEGTPFRESMQTSTKLSDALGQLVRAIAISDLKFAERQRIEEKEREERAEQWEQARERAALRFAETRKAEFLAHQVRKWKEAEEVRAYIAAARERLASKALNENEGWFEWAARQAEELDPLSRPAALTPTIPEPTPDDLVSFMGMFDPRGGHRGVD